MTDCCQWGGKCGDRCCRLLGLEGAGGNCCGSKTIMTTEEEEANRTLPGTWLWLHKSNNQGLMGVQVGGNVIIITWCQIPPCQRAQRVRKNGLLCGSMMPTVMTTKDATVTPLHWHCPPCCTRAPASIALQFLPLLIWCCCPHHASVFAFLMLASLPLLC
jgi:hypothetical protein